jgi:hypothetical protein
LRPTAIARVASAFHNDVARNDARTWLEMGRQSARDAEAQNAVATLSDCDFKRAAELYLPATTNHGDAGTGHDSRLKLQPCYRHKVRPVYTTQ